MQTKPSIYQWCKGDTKDSIYEEAVILADMWKLGIVSTQEIRTDKFNDEPAVFAEFDRRGGDIGRHSRASWRAVRIATLSIIGAAV